MRLQGILYTWFYKYARKIGHLEKEKEAYHYKGTLENSNILNIITGIVEIDKLKQKCKEYNATIKKQTNGEELCQIDKNIVLNIKCKLLT